MSERNHIPRYRKHKQSGQAIVTLPDGLGGRRDVLLGKYGTKQSRLEYDRVITEWEAAGRQTPANIRGTADFLVNELLAAYWNHVEEYYRHPDGTPTIEVHNIKLALRPLRQLYGSTAAAEFDSLALEAVRLKMLNAGHCRTRINKDVARVKRVFKWAASKKLLPVSVHQTLTTVEGLRAGRSKARETAPVTPVREGLVEATLLYLSPPVAAMVQLQLLTGMRPGEVVRMRGIDLDTAGKIWLYRPGSDQGPVGQHKTSWHGHKRVIMIGPRGQEILRPWLRLNLNEFLFQPKEAEEARDRKRRLERRTRMTPSQAGRRRKRRPGRGPTDHYTVAAYAHAVQQACRRAGTRVRVTMDPAGAGTAVKIEATTQAGTYQQTQPGQLVGRVISLTTGKLVMRDQRKQREHHFVIEPGLEMLCDGQPWQLEDLRTALPHWHPNQLRHTKATEIRREYGLDAARVVLGHRSPQITETYAELDMGRAAEVMARLG